MNEIWRDVVGFEDAYQVSNLGRVRSKTRFVVMAASYKSAEHVSRRNGRLLRPGKASKGYFTVSLGRGKSRTVHSLVAEAFIGPRPEGYEVLHIDGTRVNNCANNLRYGTRLENIMDAVNNGTWLTSERRRALDKGRQTRWGGQ